MAIETKVIELGGKRYMVEQFGAWTGAAVMRKILPIMGPILLSILESAQSQDKEMSDILPLIFKGVCENIEKLDDETIKTLLSKVYDDNGRQINIDQEFAGKYSQLFQLIWKVIEVNNFIEAFQEGEDSDAPKAAQ